VRRLRRLSSNRGARQDEAAFVIDGPTLLREALGAGVEVQEVIATVEADERVVSLARAAGAEVWEVAADVLGGAVDTVTPQGMAAIARRVEVDTEVALASAARGELTVVLVDVSDPGNAGTLLRAAEASGAAAVLFCGASVDPSNAKCVRASAGALFHVPVAIAAEAVAVVRELEARGLRTLATVRGQGLAYDQIDLTVPTAVLLGSEAHGLADEVVTAADASVTIPMVGRSESLNVAMAGSVICFESLRQRRRQT
jgi:TrmH family RNA methyltransferase